MDVSRRERFETLVPGLVEPLRRYLVRRTDPETAEDVLADTLLVCWRRVEDLPDEPLPWAYAVARNCLRNAERSVRRQERVVARVLAVDPPGASEPETDDARDIELTLALSRLTEEEVELVRLWAWERLTPSEIATVLEITPNAVSIRLHRAKDKLRRLLEGGRKDPGPAGHEPV